MVYDVDATERYIRDAARRRGIDPDIAVRVAKSEGLARGTWQSNLTKGGRREPSYGPFQLLVGGEGTNYPAGMGNDFKRSTGLDPSDPKNVQATIDYALDRASKDGWGAWYGAAKVGVGKRTGIGGKAAPALGGEPVRMADSGATMSDATTFVPNERMPSSSPPASAAPTTQAPGPLVQIGAEKSNKLNEAMVANAMRQGGNARNGWDAVGALAQVWAGNSAAKKNDAANASELTKAYAAANLDPAYQMAAQLGGDRGSLASSILAQEENRAGTARRVEDRQNAIADYRTKAEIDAEFETNKGPASVQEYQFAKQNGYKGSFEDWKAQGGSGSGPKTSLTPVYGTDENGNAILMQPRDDGTIVRSAMPDGVSVSTGVDKIDAGTHWVLQDKRSGETVGTIPKENRQEAYDTAAGAAEGKSDVEQATNAPKAVTQADGMLASIDGVLNDPNLSSAVGLGSIVPSIPGTSIPGTRARIDQLGGQAFLQAFESLKGGGQITEVEGLQATRAIARLDQAQSEEDFRGALEELKGIVTLARDRQAGLVAPPAQGGATGATGAAPAVNYKEKYGLE